MKTGGINMLKITDYSFLFDRAFERKNNNGLINNINVSSLSSRSTQAQLKAAGIDTNSAQYKAAIREMSKHPGSMGMSTNVQAIKNIMNTYDKDGNEIDPHTGMTGMFVTEETAHLKKRITSIPESSKEKIFNYTKKTFLKYNGMTAPEGNERSEIFLDLQRKTNKDDRLAASWTLSQYARAYAKAFVSAAKSADSNWDYGKPIPKGALDNITRESVESHLVQSGNTLESKKLNIKI